jgi:hypothetical protein
MRLFFGSIASLLLLVMLVIGCTWVDADECWVNTSGGFGGGGMIPIGAGVGATTSGGDRISSPPKGPLDESGKPNPCVAQPSPKQSSTGGSSGYTPEEQAAIDALQKVDPAEAALKNAAASYAAVALSNLVQSHIQDPAMVDSATIQQLFDQYAPIANDQALAWMASADASALSDRVLPNFECKDPPHSCEVREYCPLGDGAVCYVTGCGDGKCPYCDPFGNLIYKGYCAYACMQGTKYWGYGFNLRTRFPKPWNGFFCAPFTK